MTLGEFITQYCEEHGLSDRSFATLVGVSPQQIGNIKRGIGNNGKPMSSTMKTYKKIASAIGMDETDFLNMLNDNVAVNAIDDDDFDLTEEEQWIIKCYRRADQPIKDVIRQILLAFDEKNNTVSSEESA